MFDDAAAETRYSWLHQEYATIQGYTPEKAQARYLIREEMLQIERERALARDEQAAIPWEWPAPDNLSINQFPLILANERKTFLLYKTYTSTNFQATYKQKEHCAYNTEELVAMLNFVSCAAIKFGAPNDEIIEGHALYGRGIDVGGAYIVANSKWKTEVRYMQGLHQQFDESHWAKYKHYLLFFKERTFEAIAHNAVLHSCNNYLNLNFILDAYM